ncbi:hypothetical protein WJX81_007054 [Elliptochloris bilobata]|uniref:Macro domain-containing protein n=1 Tax=Elliptochloris bilobata TaxID=381761 RepID=A0AAW1RKX6_9CHLO
MCADQISRHEKRFPLQKGAHLVLQLGNITHWSGDVTINASNMRMLGGGGVDGAVHAAAGPELLAACRRLPTVRRGARCPTGEARGVGRSYQNSSPITEGYRLPVRHVIHMAGPVYGDQTPEESERLLSSAYRSCLELASAEGMATTAFPAISCGMYGFPLADAAKVAVQTCMDAAGSLREALGIGA